MIDKKKKLVTVKIQFMDRTGFDIIQNPINIMFIDGCYIIDVNDNIKRIYPLTSIRKIIEHYEAEGIKPEDLEYGKDS